MSSITCVRFSGWRACDERFVTGAQSEAAAVDHNARLLESVAHFKVVVLNPTNS
jgi:hypothetical protein